MFSKSLFPILSTSFILSTSNYMFFILLPHYLRDLGLKNSMVGIIIGLSVFLTMIFRTLSGRVLDHYPAKKIFVPALLAYLLIFCLCLVKVIWVVSLLRFLQAILWGILSTALGAFMLERLPFQDRGAGLSLMAFTSVLPACFAPSLALLLHEYIPINSIFLVIFALILISYLFSLSIEETPVSAKEALPLQKEEKVLSSKLWTNSSFLCSCFILMLVYVSSAAIFTYLPLFMDPLYPSSTKYFFLLQTGALTWGRYFYKSFSPKNRIVPKKILLSLLLGLFLGHMLIISPAPLSAFFLAAVLIGLALGVIYPMLLTFICFIVPEKRKAEGTGTYTAAADLGLGLGNIFLGQISVFFSLKAVFFFSGMCALLGIIPYLFLLKNEEKRSAEQFPLLEADNISI